jgi:hypothetical protein
MDNKKPIDIPISIQRYFNIMNLLGYSIIKPNYYSSDMWTPRNIELSNQSMGLVSSYDIRPHGKMYFHINPVEYITLTTDEYGNRILHIIFNYKSVDGKFFSKWFSCEEFEKEFLSIIRDYKLEELC